MTGSGGRLLQLSHIHKFGQLTVSQVIAITHSLHRCVSVKKGDSV